MAWTPEREGNWLFHCHIMGHVSPERRLSGAAAGHVRADHAASAHAEHPRSHDESGGMAGMILGVTVLASEGQPTAPQSVERAPRKLTLSIQRGPNGSAGEPAAGFVLTEGEASPLPSAESILAPARQTIAVGETYDFEYEATGRKTLWLEVRGSGGKWQAQGQVIVK